MRNSNALPNLIFALLLGVDESMQTRGVVMLQGALGSFHCLVGNLGRAA